MYGMVACRIILGGCLAGFYLVRLPQFGLLYGAGSIAWFPLFRDYARSEWHSPLDPLVVFLAQHDLQGLAWVLYAALLLGAVSFSLGFCTRLAGTIALLLHMTFWALNPDVGWGWTEVIVSLMAYTILAPTGRWYSIDAWLARQPSPCEAPAWPMRLMQINVGTMYAVAGWSRIDDPGWLEGKMLYDALTNMWFARFAIDWHPYRNVLRVFSWGVFVLEPAASVLLWIQPLARWIALALIAMHLGLELLTNVEWWNYMMIAGLLNFLPPAWVRAGLEGLAALFTRAPVRAPARLDSRST
jgi:vitamin K-dependent gamma-carboxylase-like protein